MDTSQLFSKSDAYVRSFLFRIISALLFGGLFLAFMAYLLIASDADFIILLSLFLASLSLGFGIFQLVKDNIALSSRLKNSVNGLCNGDLNTPIAHDSVTGLLLDRIRDRLLELQTIERERQAQQDLQTQQALAEKATQEMNQLVMRSRYVVMGEMIAMISHQWRQPLATSMLNVEILTTKIKMIAMAEQEQEFLLARLSLLRDMLMEKSHLIGEFTDFFNPDRELTLFKVLSTINSVLLMFDSNLTNDGIKIIRNVNVNCEIFGIEREFKQMILNIVKNSIDQIVERNIVSPYICISVTRVEGGIFVEIGDNAGGIPEDILPKIFEAYVSTKSLNGAGLGLYMVKMIIVEHFGGSIQAYNSEVGAMFKLFIPQ